MKPGTPRLTNVMSVDHTCFNHRLRGNISVLTVASSSGEHRFRGLAMKPQMSKVIIVVCMMLFAIATVVLCWSGGYYYGKTQTLRPIVIQYNTVKTKVYDVLDDIGAPLSDDQKRLFENRVTNRQRGVMGFQEKR
jgi:hypothetical protein